MFFFIVKHISTVFLHMHVQFFNKNKILAIFTSNYKLSLFNGQEKFSKSRYLLTYYFSLLFYILSWSNPWALLFWFFESYIQTPKRVAEATHWKNSYPKTYIRDNEMFWGLFCLSIHKYVLQTLIDVFKSYDI